MPTDQKNSVQSLAKGFRLLEAVARADAPLTLSEIAAAAGLDPGTTHRMLNTLVELGYLARAEGRRFTLTLKVLDLGFHAIGRQDMRAIARPLLRALVGQVSEAASIGVLSGADVLYVERMRAGITRLGVDIRVGTLIPAATTMIGWAILAHLPPDQVPGQPSTELAADLAAVRARGYALSQSRISAGLVVLAVPVLDQDGHPVAGLSVAAPGIRMTPDELRDRALEPLLRAAGAIARGLSASGGVTE